MSRTLVEKLACVGPVLLIAGAACSTAPRSSPEASVATVTATTPAPAAPGRPADAGAPAFERDAGSSDPLEALHDAEPDPVYKPEELRPHALKIQLAEENTVVGNVGWDPYLSDDGAIAVRMQNRSSAEARHALVVLHVVELAHRDRDHEMIVVDSPDCRLSPNPPPCDYAGAKASVTKVNAFLAKHQWVAFRRYTPWIPLGDVDDCHGLHLARHFRVKGYDIQFREPHLSITSPGGVVITDRNDVTVKENPADCTKTIRTYVGGVGMDVRRRAMSLLVLHCSPDRYTCRLPQDWLFFRLPKPSK